MSNTDWILLLVYLAGYILRMKYDIDYARSMAESGSEEYASAVLRVREMEERLPGSSFAYSFAVLLVGALLWPVRLLFTGTMVLYNRLAWWMESARLSRRRGVIRAKRVACGLPPDMPTFSMGKPKTPEYTEEWKAAARVKASQVGLDMLLYAPELLPDGIAVHYIAMEDLPEWMQGNLGAVGESLHHEPVYLKTKPKEEEGWSRLMNDKLKFTVNIVERERGFGPRIERTQEFDTYEEADSYCRKYNRENNPPVGPTGFAPDSYIYAEIAGDSAMDGMRR